MNGLYRVVAPFFVAGFIVEKGLIVKAAPIIWWMRAWPVEKALQYALVRGWTIEWGFD